MTRGQIAVIINKDELLTSTEFNGDMYMPDGEWEGHGEKVIELLKETKDIADYHFAVAKFNKEHHHYCDEQLVWVCKGNEATKMLDMSKDYFETWFSDYIYIKNLSQDNVNIIDANKDTVVIHPNEIAVFNFGKFEFARS